MSKRRHVSGQASSTRLSIHTRERHAHTHTFLSILLLFICLTFAITVGQRNPSLWHWYEQQSFCSSKKRHVVTRGCLSSSHNVGIMWCFRALFTLKNNLTGLTNCQRWDRKRGSLLSEGVSPPYIRLSFSLDACPTGTSSPFTPISLFPHHPLLVQWIWDVYKSMSGQQQLGGLAFSRLPGCVCLFCIGRRCRKRKWRTG